MSNQSTKFLEGMVFGGVIGIVGGVLFAPKSGKELRQDLSHTSDELCKNASLTITDFKDRSQQALHDFQSKGDQAIKQATHQFQETCDQLAVKIQEVGTKVQHKTAQLPEPESAQHQ